MKVTAVIVSAFAACAVAAGDVTPQPQPVTVDAGRRGELGDSCGLCVLSCVRLGEGLHASVADDAVAACKLGVCEPLCRNEGSPMFWNDTSFPPEVLQGKRKCPKCPDLVCSGPLSCPQPPQ